MSGYEQTNQFIRQEEDDVANRASSPSPQTDMMSQFDPLSSVPAPAAEAPVAAVEPLSMDAAQYHRQELESEHELEFFQDEEEAAAAAAAPVPAAEASRNKSRDFVRSLLMDDSDDEDDYETERFLAENSARSSAAASTSGRGGYSDSGFASYPTTGVGTRFSKFGSERDEYKPSSSTTTGGGYSDAYHTATGGMGRFGSERSDASSYRSDHSYNIRSAMEDYDMEMEKSRNKNQPSTFKKWIVNSGTTLTCVGVVVLIVIIAGAVGSGGGGDSRLAPSSSNHRGPSTTTAPAPSPVDVGNVTNATQFTSDPTDSPTALDVDGDGVGFDSNLVNLEEPTPAPTPTPSINREPAPSDFSIETASPTVAPVLPFNGGTFAPTLPPITPEQQERLDSITGAAEQLLGRIIDWSDSTTPVSIKRALHFLAVDDGMNVATNSPDFQERLGLAVFFFATNPCGSNPCGDRWVVYDNWMTDTEVCEWHGVACDGGDVVELDLNNNGLKGHLPSELNLLTSLTKLDLSANNIFAPIPTTLVSTLETLNLANNIMVGSIPIEAYTSLPNLKVLHLNDNLLTGSLSSEISQWTNLEELHLHGNSFSGVVPDAFGSMPNLSLVRLENNQFTGDVPASLGQATGMTFLSLESNSFVGTVPSDICTLTTTHSLTHLSADCVTDVSCSCCSECR